MTIQHMYLTSLCKADRRPASFPNSRAWPEPQEW
jgi:hypothetical protein